MTDADKEHWRSVGYFFRAYYYSELIARFGDVPWVDRVLGDSDKEIAYGPRTPRKEVADHVLNDLIYAEEHIKEEGAGENTINVHVVRALLSRFCLFEGTWRKYHALGDEDKYFDACITYSKIIRCNQRNGENRRNRCKKISYETFKGCYCSCIAEEHFILRLTAF